MQDTAGKTVSHDYFNVTLTEVSCSKQDRKIKNTARGAPATFARFRAKNLCDCRCILFSVGVEARGCLIQPSYLFRVDPDKKWKMAALLRFPVAMFVLRVLSTTW